jgi:hypothetical protein
VFKITETGCKKSIIYSTKGGDTKVVHISEIEANLSKLGFRASYWFRPEIKELQHILVDTEAIIECVQGRYFGGFALLVATDRRLLLIDKKIPYLSVEDIRYDMISEINYSARLFDATINIYTVNKQHKFTSLRQKHHLRTLTTYAQSRVMEMRQYMQQEQQAEQAQPSTAAQLTQSAVPAPSLQQAYNYGQNLYLQPPNIPAETRKRLPSPHMPRIMGATALNGSRKWVNPNPYTRGSFAVRGQWTH